MNNTPNEQMALSMSSVLERNTLTYNSIHKLWGMISLQSLCPPTALSNSISVDFILVIDVSCSTNESKLAFLRASFEYVLSKLDENQTFTLIAFNHEISVLTKLVPCTKDNKTKILEIVKSLIPSGSSKIFNALHAAAEILKDRPGSQKNRISSVLLFTDGLSIGGSSSLSSISNLELPKGCTLNTFGFGNNQDSRLLHAIALKTQGVYYYVSTEESIPSTLGECIAGILSTRAHSIELGIECKDGARMVTIATPFKIEEKQLAKQYSIKLELLYRGESKSVLFRLSLRSMSQPMNCHHLLNVKVTYINTLTNEAEHLSAPISIVRTSAPVNEKIPLCLDLQLNRYSAASSISEAVDLAKKLDLTQARQKLLSTISMIKKSSSGSEPYCQDVIKDLEECISGMFDRSTFSEIGMHYAHAVASMYFMERSTGLRSRQFCSTGDYIRHFGYGYVTVQQEEESFKAFKHTKALFNTFLPPAINA